MEELAKGSIDINDLIDYLNNKSGRKKHFEGFMFDSLVYRYQLARFTQADLEAQNNGTSIEKERKFARNDIMRFIEILDEVIGDHD
jgi:hypothetical protein